MRIGGLLPRALPTVFYRDAGLLMRDIERVPYRTRRSVTLDREILAPNLDGVAASQIQTTQRYIDGDTDAQRKLVSLI